MRVAVSLDLDGCWASLKTHGDSGWREYPSLLDVVIPRALDFFSELGHRGTLFVVGRDAADPRLRDAWTAVGASEHEIANHSFDHEPWFHLYSRAKVREQIASAEEAIELATGRRPEGFRAPGFSFTREIAEELSRRGYLYDASIFPTALGPLVTACYLATTRAGGEDRRRLRRIGGRWSDALRPSRPFRWIVDPKPLLEIPVTTFPGLKLPVHVSYLQCLAPGIALKYLDAAIALWRFSGQSPSLVLHSTDFLGVEDTRLLPFVPGMARPLGEKLEFLHAVAERFARFAPFMTLAERARSLEKVSLRLIAPGASIPEPA